MQEEMWASVENHREDKLTLSMIEDDGKRMLGTAEKVPSQIIYDKRDIAELEKMRKESVELLDRVDGLRGELAEKNKENEQLKMQLEDMQAGVVRTKEEEERFN